MESTVLIYGKTTCPFTRAAREAYTASGRTVDFRDVLLDPDSIDAMLAHSGGSRRIPVIVDSGRVIIGFQGRT
ncbi:MAG: UXX-star selenoprotein family 1 [Thermodesulfobacteriota bacterium]